MPKFISEVERDFSLDLALNKEVLTKKQNAFFGKVLGKKVLNCNTMQVMGRKLSNFRMNLHFIDIGLNKFLVFGVDNDIL